MAQYVLEITDHDDRRDDLARIESDAPFPALHVGDSLDAGGSDWVVIKEIQHVIYGEPDGMRAYTKVFGRKSGARHLIR